MISQGMGEARLREMLAERPLANLRLLPYQPFERLSRHPRRRRHAGGSARAGGGHVLGAVQGPDLPVRRAADSRRHPAPEPGGPHDPAGGRRGRPRPTTPRRSWSRPSRLQGTMPAARRGRAPGPALTPSGFDTMAITDRFEGVIRRPSVEAPSTTIGVNQGNRQCRLSARDRSRRLHRRSPRPALARRRASRDPCRRRQARRRVVPGLRRRREPGGQPRAARRVPRGHRGRRHRVQPGRRHGRHGLHREQQGPVHALGADQHPHAGRRQGGRGRALLLLVVRLRLRRRQAGHARGRRPPEDDAYPAMPEDGYGWEKLFSERMCRHFPEDFGIETRVARYHNVYGPTARGTAAARRPRPPSAARWRRPS